MIFDDSPSNSTKPLSTFLPGHPPLVAQAVDREEAQSQNKPKSVWSACADQWSSEERVNGNSNVSFVYLLRWSLSTSQLLDSVLELF